MNLKLPTAESQIIESLQLHVSPLGYEVIHVELAQHPSNRTRVLRVFIDFAQAQSDAAIGIEDCVKVTHALDQAVDGLPVVEQAFKGAAYELEVSSPGIDRPLRTARDYQRFTDRLARLTTVRPLTGVELSDEAYAAKNPKQKNFLGTLGGLTPDGSSVYLTVSLTGSGEDVAGKKKPASKTPLPRVTLPLNLIAKANLEPTFDFEAPVPAKPLASGRETHDRKGVISN